MRFEESDLLLVAGLCVWEEEPEMELSIVLARLLMEAACLATAEFCQMTARAALLAAVECQNSPRV